MNLRDLEIICETEIVFHNIDCHTQQCRIENCEIIDNGVLISFFGQGKTKEEAMKDLVNEIQGKRIVFHAWDSNKRREYPLPEKIYPNLNKPGT